MLIAKGVVDTLAVDPHVLHQILDRRSLVTACPENLHGFMEDFIAIELFLARHLCCRLFFILFLERTVKNPRSGQRGLNSATFLCSSLLPLIMNIICHACFVSSDRALVCRLTIFFYACSRMSNPTTIFVRLPLASASPMMRRRQGSSLSLLPTARQPDARSETKSAIR